VVVAPAVRLGYAAAEMSDQTLPPMKATSEGGSEGPRPARLVVVEGRATPPTLELDAAARPVHLGRADENDVVLASDRVSRHHVKVMWEDGHWLVVDAGSKNGTQVNGVTLEASRPVRLRDLDRIQICDHCVLFLAGESADARMRTIALDRSQVSAEAEEALRKFLPDL